MKRSKDNQITNELVSVIIPCYNYEKVVSRCLDSLKNQSYKKLEIIFVNDGSKDQSGHIAKEYQKIFRSLNIKFLYIEQHNKGLGGAINTGLKYFTGEYLCWGDPDDFWYPESISIRKEFLDENTDYGSVSSDAHFYKEEDLNHPEGLLSETAKDLDNENQFLNHLQGRPLFCPGCHMLRSSAFLDVNPKRKIYPAKEAQNNQLLMPIYYKYKHKFLPIPLYGYVVHSDSMDHRKLPKNKAIEKIKDYYKSVQSAVSTIDMPKLEKKYYLKINMNRKIDSLLDFATANNYFIMRYYYIFLKILHRKLT